MDGPGRGTIRTKPTLRSWSKPSTRRPSSRPSSTRRPRIKRSQDADAQLFLMALLYRIDPDDIDPALTARVRARGVRASDVRINWAELMGYKRSFTERGLRIIV